MNKAKLFLLLLLTLLGANVFGMEMDDFDKKNNKSEELEDIITVEGMQELIEFPDELQCLISNEILTADHSIIKCLEDRTFRFQDEPIITVGLSESCDNQIAVITSIYNNRLWLRNYYIIDINSGKNIYTSWKGLPQNHSFVFDDIFYDSSYDEIDDGKTNDPVIISNNAMQVTVLGDAITIRSESMKKVVENLLKYSTLGQFYLLLRINNAIETNKPLVMSEELTTIFESLNEQAQQSLENKVIKYNKALDRLRKSNDRKRNQMEE